MRLRGVALLFLALAGCQSKKSESLHIDPALESLVPADTAFVAGANLLIAGCFIDKGDNPDVR